MKRAIRYLRFSRKGQSNSSIESQDLYTHNWLQFNQVALIDTFIDAGHSAKTFDRPDMKKLTEFIQKHHKHVDYLVVSEMDRFSRDAGEAITLIKKLQVRYAIQIVAAVEGIVYDYRDSSSFFRTGLSFLLAEDDNIRRTNKINSGIYTAKAKEGRFIGSKAPFGYKLEGIGKQRHLVIDEPQASFIRLIYERYLSGVPIYLIKAEVIKLGFPLHSNSIIEKILSNAIYSGQQEVKPWRQLPGGIFPANHSPIIDLLSWNKVQDKLNGKVEQNRTIVNDQFPLRSLLMCNCGNKVTGAFSKGKLKRYPYYKCKEGRGHLNINADKANRQMEQILSILSLPKNVVDAIYEKAKDKMASAVKDNKERVIYYRSELATIQKKIESLENKFIEDQVSFETYNRLYNDLVKKRSETQHLIEKLSTENNKAEMLLFQNVYKLSDMCSLYRNASTHQKKSIINLVFDSKIYHDGTIYRTPYIMKLFRHKLLILKQEQLLEFVNTGGNVISITPYGGAEGSRTPVQTYLQ